MADENDRWSDRVRERTSGDDQDPEPKVKHFVLTSGDGTEGVPISLGVYPSVFTFTKHVTSPSLR